MTARQKIWGLVGLLLIWTVLLAVRFLNAPEPQHVALKFTSLPLRGSTAMEKTSRLARAGENRNEPLESSVPAEYKNIFQPLHLMVAAERAGEATVARKARHPNVRVLEDPHVMGQEGKPPPSSETSEPLEHLVVGPPAPPDEWLSPKEAYRRREMALEEARLREELADQEAKRQQELLIQQARQQKEAALQQARQLMGQYRFLGYVSQDGQQHAFLGKGHELFVVSAGEIVDGRLRIKAMDANSVKLLDPRTSLETTLVLVKEGKETF